MLKLIISIINMFIIPLFYSKKNLILKYSLLKLENDILKRRLSSQNKKLLFKQVDRILYSIISNIFSGFKSIISLIQPATILKWTRQIVKYFWKYPKKKPGRPPVPSEVKDLILKIKNSTMNIGYGQIQGELLKLGISLSERTIARILQAFRKKGLVKNTLTWSKFIKSHINSMFAMDFFTVDSILGIRFYILFIMHLATRKIVYFDITRYPSMNFVQQRLSDFTWNRNTKEKIYLIHDNFSSFIYIDYEAFDIIDVRITTYSPNLNAFAERFIRSVREEALDWFVIFTENQLRKIISEYISYFNTLRPHQGISQNIPAGFSPQIKGPIRSSPVLDGLRCHFYRKTA